MIAPNVVLLDRKGPVRTHGVELPAEVPESWSERNAKIGPNATSGLRIGLHAEIDVSRKTTLDLEKRPLQLCLAAETNLVVPQVLGR